MAELKIPVSEQDHRRGGRDASVVLVEYGDYECPHCGHAHPVVGRLLEHFGKRLAFVYRNFPLNEIHPNAESAAETAEYAGARHKFWEMHDGIFENQRELGPELLMQLTQELGLPAEGLRASLEAREFEPRVKSDFLGGARSGVNGTPTFFINAERFDGPADFESLRGALEAALA